MKAPQTFVEIINLWPTTGELASDIGVKEVTARAWKARGTIPAEYWNDIVSSAARREISGITLDLFADIAEAQPRRRRSQLQGATTQ